MMSTAVAAVLGSLGIRPLTAPAEEPRRRARLPPTDSIVLTTRPDVPEALTIAAPTLTAYEATASTLADHSRWRARFDQFLWNARGKAMNERNYQVNNERVGSLTVAGDPASGRYQMLATRTAGGLATSVRMRVSCDAGSSPNVKAWEAEFGLRANDAAWGGDPIMENGVVDGARAAWKRPVDRAEVPLAPGHAMADGIVFAAGGSLTAGAFGLLVEGAHWMGPVTLGEPEPIDVIVGPKKKPSRWSTRVLHGGGILPAHLIVDERGQCVIVTQHLVGFCLREVAAWDGKDLAI